MKEKEIRAMLDRYRAGRATDEDLAFLETWYLKESGASRTAGDYDLAEVREDVEEVWSRLNPSRRSSSRRLLPYAAAAVLVLGLAGVWWQWSAQRNAYLDLEEIVASRDDSPTITLPDGTVIRLDESRSTIQMGTDVRYEDGTPVPGLDRIPAEELHIQVPTGTTYQLLLSDSTRVWLNAGSSLRYPAVFTGDERVVRLKGGAYFEVQPQRHTSRNGARMPFLVETDLQTIEVLGTRFNVNAHSGPVHRTTLVEGKVQLMPVGTDALVPLLPGQELWVSKTHVNLLEVDTDIATSWVNGLFNFDNKSFREIMEEVSRWYDLEVVYEGAVPEETFFGQAYRSDNLATVLRLLESAQIQYRVTNDRKLIIQNKSEKSGERKM